MQEIGDYMKGLLFKDLFTLRKQGKVYLLLVVFYVFYSMLMKNVSMLSAMLTILCAIAPITTLAYDENCKWDRYALSMPISRKMIVLSKYVFGLLLLLISMAIVTPLSMVVVSYTREMKMMPTFMITLVVNGIAVLFLSVLLPLLFKFGVEKGRLFMFMIFFIPMAIAYLYNKMNLSLPSKETLKILGYLSPVFLVIILLISITISIKIYEKKEF